MQAFTDSHGREWLIRLTVGSIANVYERLGLSCYALIEDQNELAELLDNAPLLANVVYLLCRGQARRMRVSPSDFCRGITEIESMQEAFIRALVRFFPDPDPKQQKKPGGVEQTRDHAWWERSILEAAGVAQLDPLRHSLRTIQHVAFGRQAEAWNHTSCLMAQVANLHRDRKKRTAPFTPDELNPFLAATKGPKVAAPKDGTTLIGAMAGSFIAPEKQEKFALILAAKQRAKATGDWTEFRRLTS